MPSATVLSARKPAFFDCLRSQRPRIRHRGHLFRSAARHRPAASNCASWSTSSPGASAGGINGTMLARALTHDLPMDALRDLWLENADVTVLLSPDARAGDWSKWFLQAIHLGRRQNRHVQPDAGPGGAPEALAVRALALVQAAARRASVMAALMYDAVTAMGAANKRQGVACCPPAIRSTCSSRSPIFTATSSSFKSTIRRSSTSWSTTRFCISPTGATRAAKSTAISNSTMRRASHSPRAPPRRFRARFRRRGSSRWTRSSPNGRTTGRAARNSSPGLFSPTCRPASIRRRHPSSTARCSTTGRFSRRSPRSTAGRPTARSTGGWSTSIRIRRRRRRRGNAASRGSLPQSAGRCPISRVRSR